jgi:hypothetical protein
MQMDHPTTDMSEQMNSSRSAVEIMQESQDLYERKNADYGDSWKLAGKTMALWFQHQGKEKVNIPTNEFHLTSFQLFTRRLDKMIREFNGWFMLDEGDSFQVEESIIETHQDDVPYAAMHTQLAEEYAEADVDDLI